MRIGLILVTETQNDVRINQRGVGSVKVTIIGTPKEIAAFAEETQKRQIKTVENYAANTSIKEVEAMARAIKILQAAKSGDLDQMSRASEGSIRNHE